MSTLERRLPPIDDTGLIDEDDRDALDRYAKNLLAHWKRLAVDGRTVAGGYTKGKIKVATVWLLSRYADHEYRIPPELPVLVKVIIRPDKTLSTSRKVQKANNESYWLAVYYESKFGPDPKGKAPSAATLYGVAKHVREEGGLPNLDKRSNRNVHHLPDPAVLQKTAEATIRGWRKLMHYRDNVALHRPATGVKV